MSWLDQAEHDVIHGRYMGGLGSQDVEWNIKKRHSELAIDHIGQTRAYNGLDLEQVQGFCDYHLDRNIRQQLRIKLLHPQSWWKKLRSKWCMLHRTMTSGSVDMITGDARG